MKGQTAMEYLMTYGWAIVVIVIVLAALAALFSQSQTFEYCSFSPVGSFTCDGNPAIYEQSGNIYVKLTFRNNYAEEVDFSNGEITCNGHTTTGVGTVAPGATETVDINCGDVGDPGEKFDQEIQFKYQLPSDVDAGTFRTAKAIVRGSIGTT